MRGEQTEYRVGVGASSILMILVVLALAALSLLAFGSARSTEALTARNAEMTAAYYQAAAEAQHRVAAIDTAVMQYRIMDPTPAFDELWFASQGIQAEWQQAEAGLAFVLEMPAGEKRVLRVTGEAYPEGERRYRLTSHTLLAGEEPDLQPLNLMGIK